MTSLPLHPALVHLPLGLAFVVPAFALVFAVALWLQFLRRARANGLGRAEDAVALAPRRPGPRTWITVVALQAMLFGGALLAMNTGEREEDRVERVVADAALERHAGYAEQFVWAAGATFALAALVLVFRRPPAALLLVTATAGASLVVAGLALRVGKAGGELVYVHNAASAYTSAAFGGTVETQSATVTAGEQSPTAPAPHREEDERRGERRRRR